jgi:hypothetical protein
MHARKSDMKRPFVAILLAVILAVLVQMAGSLFRIGVVEANGNAMPMAPVSPAAPPNGPAPPEAANSPLEAKTINQIHYANQWCGIRGRLDDTCFSNAINDIAAHGPTGLAGRRMGVILVPPGVYTFNKTVTVPLGLNISIEGATQDTVWGAVMEAGDSHANFFAIDADSVNIDHLVFRGDGKEDAITLGSARQGTFDSHVNWNWFINIHYCLHLVNYSGGDFSHNTSDASTAEFVHSDANRGDRGAQDLMLNDDRVYGNATGIDIRGDGTERFGNIQIGGGIFDHSTLSSSQEIAIERVSDLSITGTIFNNSAGGDISLKMVNAASITGTVHDNTGASPIRLEETNAVVISGISIHNCNVSALAEKQAGILVINGKSTVIANVVGLADKGKGLCANGVSISPDSSQTTIGAVSLAISTGPSIADASSPTGSPEEAGPARSAPLQYIGTLTTTAATSDSIVSAGVPVGAHCAAQAQNARAASLPGVSVPPVTTAGVVVIHHAATAGGDFSILCPLE